MNIYETLKTALGGLKYPITRSWTITGPGPYFTYTSSRRGTDHADNRPQIIRTHLMLHFFCPPEFDPDNVIGEAENRLFAAGFSWPHTMEITEENPACRHVIFSCWYVEKLED